MVYVDRFYHEQLMRALDRSPSVAVLGPRQCGKSTFIRHIIKNKNAIYLDLQLPSERNKLNDPELFFTHFRDRLVCLDEIQTQPELFSILRSEIDQDRRPGRFIFLGSASRDLIKQTKESLAGRIAFVEMTPFLWCEISDRYSLSDYQVRGGFPESLNQKNSTDSFDWRRDFIATFLERDIPNLGFYIPLSIMQKLWQMLAHYHGQVVNYSKLSESIDITTVTLKRYISILEQTYMIRVLHPYHSNLKKRTIKAPKIYIRDTGILHGLLNIMDFESLLGHPVVGASWEGLVIENLCQIFSRWEPFYIRTSNGAELDLLFTQGNKKIGIECKFSKTPKKSKGFASLQEELKPDASYLVAPVDQGYDLDQNTKVRNLTEMINEIKS
jgi:predicted AAA+ superfamily ATPase